MVSWVLTPMVPIFESIGQPQRPWCLALAVGSWVDFCLWIFFGPFSVGKETGKIQQKIKGTFSPKSTQGKFCLESFDLCMTSAVESVKKVQ